MLKYYFNFSSLNITLNNKHILLWCIEELFIDPGPLVFILDPNGAPKPPVPMPKSPTLKFPSPLTLPTKLNLFNTIDIN